MTEKIIVRPKKAVPEPDIQAETIAQKNLIMPPFQTSNTKKSLNELVASAPPLPPLPADPITYVEKVFRPRYEEFMGKLRKLTDELS